jgi:hypothetical protein
MVCINFINIFILLLCCAVYNLLYIIFVATNKSRSSTPTINLRRQKSYDLPKDAEDQQLLLGATSMYGPKITNNRREIQVQQSSTASTTSSSLIGPFKNDLEVCIFLVQRPDIIELALNMIKASGQESVITQTIQGKSDKLNALSERVNY